MEVDERALFREAEVRAERTVAGLRIASALFLGAVFAVAVVRDLPRDDAMLLRQMGFAVLAMGGYLALGILTRRLAGTRHYRPWMSWVFATLDVGFVTANVASTAVNTGIPANFAASFPSIWLVPAVLAFGALRYNPYLQAYVLALLTAGFAALVVLSGATVEIDGPRVQPLGYFFGLPPNVMRGVMVFVAGAVLVLAAARARSLLRRAVEETRRRANLTRYLPPEIAGWLAETSAEELRRGRRQPVAVLFADVRGFTARAEDMDPADLGAFVNRYRACVTRAAERSGGVVDKFVGDSAMVVFGVPAPGPADARNALACARALLAEIDAWNATSAPAADQPVRIGIGVHCGEVFCGAVGDDTRLEFTVLGDTVNVAARVEQLTKTAGHPLIVTADLLAAAGEDPAGWTALPEEPLRGRHRPLRLFARPAA